MNEKQAISHTELVQEAMNPITPKSEREHALVKEIEMLRDALSAESMVERNKLASWMIRFGFSTGHGDTMEELLDELENEILDKVGAKR